MSGQKKAPRASILFVFLLGFAGAAFAQGVSINAEVDRTEASLNDQIVLSVSVAGNQANVPDPQLPSLPNFNVSASGQTQSINIINGQISSSRVYTYVLTPRLPGKATIGPITVDAGGKQVATSPIDITISRTPTAQAQASQQAPPGGGQQQPQMRARSRGTPGSPDVFVVASVDKDRVYVNEQVTLTVRFYTGVNLLGNAQYEPPTLQGFISEDLPPERHGETVDKGRPYHYSEIKTALFPAQSGKLTVGSAKVRCQVETAISADPFAPDFFQKMFSGNLGAQPRELRTDPVTIQVLPLPENSKPASFTGAVGSFRVSAGVDRRSVKVGDAVTYSMTVEGKGNFRALDAPKFPEMPSFRVFDTVSSMNLTKENDVVKGSKVFKTVLVPRASGKITIPSIPFSYFDPASHEYVNAGTAPIELDVTGSAPAAASVGYVAAGTASPGVTQLQDDIRYIKDNPTSSGISRLLSVLARMGWANAIPFAIFLLTLLVTQYQERANMDPVRNRFRGALSKASKQLREAQALAPTEPAKAAELLSTAMTGYLSDKLNVPAQGMTLKDIQQTLRSRARKAPPESFTQLKAVWDDLDQMRFAGAEALDGPRTDALVSEIEGLLKTLEKDIRR